MWAPGAPEGGGIPAYAGMTVGGLTWILADGGGVAFLECGAEAVELRDAGASPPRGVA